MEIPSIHNQNGIGYTSCQRKLSYQSHVPHFLLKDLGTALAMLIGDLDYCFKGTIAGKKDPALVDMDVS